MADVKYIAETKEFIVDGQVIKESTLTEEEKKKLLEQSKKVELLVGECQPRNGQLIL
ncbi:hypothetical protein KY334_05490 [Candidatus Woesearchaeota archaeon]|nr:hypothetical protein [Candidatus Woesearchaeota archaeon]